MFGATLLSLDPITSMVDNRHNQFIGQFATSQDRANAVNVVLFRNEWRHGCFRAVQRIKVGMLQRLTSRGVMCLATAALGPLRAWSRPEDLRDEPRDGTVCVSCVLDMHDTCQESL
jgi:hypothetical protein